MSALPGAGRHFGFRGRLALAIAAIVVVAFAAAFVAVYRGTGAALRGQIDDDLRTEVTGFVARVEAAPPRPAAIRGAARAFIATQPFGPAARLFIARIAGAGVVTNQPELVNARREPETESPASRRVEAAQARSLLAAPLGYSSIDLVDAGDVRLLTRRVPTRGGPRVTVSVGEPLEPVERAQSQVARTFLVVGAVTLALALVAAYLVAARVAAPLRRMARVATKVDAGDLKLRIGSGGARDEVRTLAEAFDHMLDRLEEAFARQREFVSDASHELRTPLTAIRGQIEVLALEPAPSAERVRAVSELVEREIVRMQRLADDLLGLARLDEDSGGAMEAIDVRPFLADLVEARGIAGQHRIELEVAADGVLFADPAQIAQVLRNLLRNAAEHTSPTGVIRLTATARGDRLELIVDDDGPGIPPAERERVFDRFHRVDQGRGRRSGGSGLGLAISRAIVEGHGGRIAADESPLGGARLIVELPRFEPRRSEAV